MNPTLSLNWWHGLWAFFVALLLQLIVSILMAAVSHGWGDAAALFLASPPGWALQIAASSSVFALVALIFASRPTVGLRTTLSLKPAGGLILILGSTGALATGILNDGLSSLLYNYFPAMFDLALLESLGQLFHNASNVHFFWLTLAITLGPAFGEELLFRGVLLKAFSGSWPGPVAVIVSSIFFGAMHMDMLQGVGAAFIGLYLGYLVYRSGSIWPGIVAHAVNNLTVSFTAKFETTGLHEILTQGHPPMLLAAAGVTLVLSVVGIEKVLRTTRTTRTTSSNDQRSS